MVISPNPVAVRQLRNAAEIGKPCAPVRHLIGRNDVDAAYAVQWAIAEERIASGAQIVGRKVGLTSLAVQAQLGVNQPDFGILFDDMSFIDDGSTGGADVPAGLLIQPRVEAEVAFVLGADLDGDLIDDAQVRSAVEWVIPSLEIVDSRIQDWDITLVDTVADNGSSGLFVLGDARLSLSDISPQDVEMTMSVDGRVVSQGDGTACLGDPLHALAWLARISKSFGRPLKAGEVILSGALGPMHILTKVEHVIAELSGLGRVEMTYGR